MHAPPTLPPAQGTSDAVLDRMLQAFGTSPLLSGAGAARTSMDSDQISLESVSEPTSEEDEWFAEVRSAKNPEPYVIQRPFDFAAFHCSLESVNGPYALAGTMPPTVHQSQPSLAPVARRKSARKRVPAPPVHPTADTDPSDKGERTSLLRRLGRCMVFSPGRHHPGAGVLQRLCGGIDRLPCDGLLGGGQRVRVL